MPLYTYRCAECGEESTEFNTIARRHKNTPNCCGAPTKLKITPTQIQAQILGGGATPGYHCPITGKFVTSRKERREIMKRHNVVEAGDSSSATRDRSERLAQTTNGTGVVS